MSKKYGITINDIHFGIRDSKRLYDELNVVFKPFILDHPEIEFIFFNGDFFDHKLTLCEPESLYAMLFFKEIFDIAKERNIVIRMIQGTRSHEMNQLEIFRSYELENSKGTNFKIFNTVTEETLNGIKILYIPEEYPVDADEYYKQYRENKYDIIFGHGTWDFVAQQGQAEHGNRKDTYSAPVFSWNEWKNSVDAFVSFGHIHGRNKYGNKIFYSGSFTRWNFGERSSKGFTYFSIDPGTKEYSVEFIDNDVAPRFDVLSAAELNIENLPTDDLIKILDEEVKRSDNLRIDFVNISEENLAVIKNYYKDNLKVKIDLRKKKTFLQESADTERFKKWHYITKRTLPLDKTIQKYCKEEMNTDFTLEEIKNAIS